jgi:hypothetical protein
MPGDRSFERELRQFRNQIAHMGEADRARVQDALDCWIREFNQQFTNTDFYKKFTYRNDQKFANRKAQLWVEFLKKHQDVSEVRPIILFKKPVAYVSWASRVSRSASPADPPTRACALLDRLLPKADRNVIRGDMEEEFKARLAKDGPTRARRWFWRETVWTIVQQNAVVRSVLLGGLMRLGEWIFRQIGG